jgi:hypothetical protein
MQNLPVTPATGLFRYNLRLRPARQNSSPNGGPFARQDSAGFLHRSVYYIGLKGAIYEGDSHKIPENALRASSSRLRPPPEELCAGKI